MLMTQLRRHSHAREKKSKGVKSQKSVHRSVCRILSPILADLLILPVYGPALEGTASGISSASASRNTRCGGRGAAHNRDTAVLQSGGGSLMMCMNIYAHGLPAVCQYGRAVAAGTYAGVGSPGLVPPPRRGAAGTNRGQGCCADREYRGAVIAVQARGDIDVRTCMAQNFDIQGSLRTSSL